MNKSCENCYWYFGKDGYKGKYCACHDDKQKDICDRYKMECQECETEQATYKYEGKNYCTACLLEKFELETYTVTQYYNYGEYLGDSDNIDEVIKNLDGDIEEIE